MAEENESQNATIQDESMATERTDKLDRCLTAIKEDLAAWVSRLLRTDIPVDSFLQSIDTGVTLGRLANHIQTAGEEFLLNNPNQAFLLPKNGVTFRERGAHRGSFIARDNVANIIQWCRQLGVPEVLMFETEDLVTHKNEKSVLLALLDVGRKAYKFGVDPPELVRIEKEIDREIEEQPEEHEEVEVQKVVEYHLRKRQKSHSLDDLVYKVLDQCTCPVKFPVLRLSEGKYRVGENKNLIFVRVMRNHVMVRVGGGWDTLERYFDKHDPCRVMSDKHKANRQRRGSNKPSRNCSQPQCDGFTRSPSSMSTCSMSSGDSGSSSTLSHTRTVYGQETASHVSNQTRRGSNTSRRNASPSPATRVRQTNHTQANLSSSAPRRENSALRLTTSRTLQTTPSESGTRKSRSMHDLRSIANPLERVEITSYRPTASRNGRSIPCQGANDRYPKSAPGTPSRTRKTNVNLASITAKVDSRRSSLSRSSKPAAVDTKRRPSSATVSRSSSFGSRSDAAGPRPQRSRTLVEPTRRSESRRTSEPFQRSRSSVCQFRNLRTTEKQISRSASISPQRRPSKSNLQSTGQKDTKRRPKTSGVPTGSPRNSQITQPTNAMSPKKSPTRKLSSGSGRSKPVCQQNVETAEKIKTKDKEKKPLRKDSRKELRKTSIKKDIHASEKRDICNEISSVDRSEQESKPDINHNIEYGSNQMMTNEQLNSHYESPYIVTALNVPQLDVCSDSGCELIETDLTVPSLDSSYSDTSFVTSSYPENKLLESKRLETSPSPPTVVKNESGVAPLSLKERLENLNVKGSAVSSAVRGRIYEQTQSKEENLDLDKQNNQLQLDYRENREGLETSYSEESQNSYGFLYQGPPLGKDDSSNTNTCDARKGGWSFVKSLVSSIETTYKRRARPGSPRKSQTVKTDSEQSSSSKQECKETTIISNNNEKDSTACASQQETNNTKQEKQYLTNDENREILEPSLRDEDDNKKCCAEFANQNSLHRDLEEQPEKCVNSHESHDQNEHEFLSKLKSSDSDSNIGLVHQRDKRNSRDLSDYFPKPCGEISIENLIQDAIPIKNSTIENGDSVSPTSSRYEALI